MMAMTAILEDLAERGITLSVEGEALRYDAPAGAMTPVLVATIREHKPALVAALSAASAGPTHADLELERFAQVAVMDPGGGWSDPLIPYNFIRYVKDFAAST